MANNIDTLRSLIRQSNPGMGAMTAHVMATRLQATDPEEEDITEVCPFCDGGLTDSDVAWGTCPHCGEGL